MVMTTIYRLYLWYLIIQQAAYINLFCSSLQLLSPLFSSIRRSVHLTGSSISCSVRVDYLHCDFLTLSTNNNRKAFSSLLLSSNEEVTDQSSSSSSSIDAVSEVKSNNSARGGVTSNSRRDDINLNLKYAMAKHTILTIAAAVMQVPAEVFTTPPMVDPNPPSSDEEIIYRNQVSSILEKGWGLGQQGLSTRSSHDNHHDVGHDDKNEDVSDDVMTGLFQNSIMDKNTVDEKMNSLGSGHKPSTYGEVTELGARQLFHYMNMMKHHNATFVDLGSGGGRLVIQALLETPSLSHSSGIELSPARHKIATSIWTKLQNEIQQARMNRFGTMAKLDLLEGDLFDLDLTSATHIYVASLCFTDLMMDRLAQKIVKEIQSLSSTTTSLKYHDSGYTLQCLATLRKFPLQYEEQLGTPRQRYVEMSWTKPRGQGCIVYFYDLSTSN